MPPPLRGMPSRRNPFPGWGEGGGRAPAGSLLCSPFVPGVPQEGAVKKLLVLVILAVLGVLAARVVKARQSY